MTSVVDLQPTPISVQKQVRQLADNTKNIRYTEHARERMAERGFTTDDVVKILRTGEVIDIEIDEKKSIVMTVVKEKLGSKRMIGVVAKIRISKDLVVITVKYVDPK